MRRILLLAVLAWSLCATVVAEQTQCPPEVDAAIRATVKSYVAAFDRGDAAGVAAHWAKNGRIVTPAGKVFQGREAIEKGFAGLFENNAGAKVEVDIASLGLDKAGKVVEQGTTRVTLPGKSATETSYVASYTKQEGKWLITNVQESAEAPTHYEKLKELEWMIGDWVDADNEATVETACRWTKNQNFITRSFAVSIAGRIDLEGTQVIGWDPSAKTIRSWMFDSDGGFGVGAWSRKGDRWEIKGLRVLPDGRKASVVNVFTRVDKNSFTWESAGREVDGEVLPSIGPVTVVRKQPAKSSTDQSR